MPVPVTVPGARCARGKRVAGHRAAEAQWWSRMCTTTGRYQPL
ncbi:Hypothetical protein SCLAV_2847 [Streptomyces clavuligerus]|uniref:Uncharacterized protein n=1 Tax=Streptomyces clavuligerus TaxID=1901 RepID=E2PVK6_STRCL|nr:Hypothetical protein SCLAV_2847 [Streptomyces clavuligerus]